MGRTDWEHTLRVAEMRLVTGGSHQDSCTVNALVVLNVLVGTTHDRCALQWRLRAAPLTITAPILLVSGLGGAINALELDRVSMSTSCFAHDDGMADRGRCAAARNATRGLADPGGCVRAGAQEGSAAVMVARDGEARVTEEDCLVLVLADARKVCGGVGERRRYATLDARAAVRPCSSPRGIVLPA